MKKFFRDLSLPKKLILISVVPLAFFTYTAFQLYKEKSNKVQLLQLYTQRIYQGENLTRLIDALQNERKLSFDLSIGNKYGSGLQQQRLTTDSIIRLVRNSGDDISLFKFEEYTFVNGLGATRKRIDDGKAASAEIMDSYTNMIFRLNTLNTSFPATSVYLKPVAKDLAAQRILTEMLTYLGILRSNIFNVLHSKQYVVETLIGSQGVHKVYHSYETEFRIKAPAPVIDLYTKTRNTTQLKPTLDYIDTVFRRFSFDSTYTAETWWKVSDEGIASLRGLQENIWGMARDKIDTIMSEEQTAKNQALLFLVIAIVIVIVLVSYVLHTITRMLNELKTAAEKISRGDRDVDVDITSNDAIGSLAASIKQMERQVSERTIALQKMNTALENSNKELEQFAYIASHDLQEPLRKIRIFADQLKLKNAGQLDEQGNRFIDKITSSAERMKMIITDLLRFSQLSRQDEVEPVDLNVIMENVKADLEMFIAQKQAVIHCDRLPVIQAVAIQMNQLFYNLVNNALKFSRKGVPPVIDISVTDPSMDELLELPAAPLTGPFYKIVVSDNGIGFAQEYAEKIFSMFQRLSSEKAGTGIGLALCKKIVENHKGSIRADSVEGQGTRFTIILPQSAPHN